MIDLVFDSSRTVFGLLRALSCSPGEVRAISYVKVPLPLQCGVHGVEGHVRRGAYDGAIQSGL